MATSANTFQALLQSLEIAQWDLVLVGDGSGSKYGNAIGWACVAVLKDEVTRYTFHGAANNGTVSIAELMAYMIPLSWYVDKVLKLEQRIRHVHIITDSQYTQSGGEGGDMRAKNLAFWAAYRMFNTVGLKLHWHWLRRETAELNVFCDEVSRQARIAYQDHAPSDTVLNDRHIESYDPFE